MGRGGHVHEKLEEPSLQVCEAVPRLPGELRNSDCSSHGTWNVEHTAHYTLHTIHTTHAFLIRTLRSLGEYAGVVYVLKY